MCGTSLGPPPTFQPTGEGRQGSPEAWGDEERAGSGHPSHGLGLPGSPIVPQPRAQLRRAFPKKGARASVPEDRSGRGLSTSRQISGWDKGRGHTHTPPPISPHSPPPEARLPTGKGWREMERGLWSLTQEGPRKNGSLSQNGDSRFYTVGLPFDEPSHVCFHKCLSRAIPSCPSS